jgi:hypothetical protein
MINRGMVPDPRPLPKPWRDGEPPTRGRYLVIDRINRSQSVAQWHPRLGWCVLGRWLGRDAVLCWAALPDDPPIERVW